MDISSSQTPEVPSSAPHYSPFTLIQPVNFLAEHKSITLPHPHTDVDGATTHSAHESLSSQEMEDSLALDLGDCDKLSIEYHSENQTKVQVNTFSCHYLGMSIFPPVPEPVKWTENNKHSDSDSERLVDCSSNDELYYCSAVVMEEDTKQTPAQSKNIDVNNNTYTSYTAVYLGMTS